MRTAPRVPIAEFTRFMVGLKAGCAGFKQDPDEWNLQLGVYHDAFATYPLDVLKAAFDRAGSQFKYFPSKQELGSILTEEYTRAQMQRNERDRARALPAPGGGGALQDFYAACDRIKDLGDEFQGHHRPQFEGLLVMLGRIYGLKEHDLRGDFESRDPDKRFNYVRSVVGHWDQANLSPAGCVRMLRKIPKLAAKYPTPMFFETVYRGGSVSNWPGEMSR